MDLDTLKKKLLDVPTIRGASRSEAIPTKLLCSDGDFAAFQTESGFGAIWTGHAAVVADKDELLDLLNKHEQTLLAYEVNK